MNLETIQTFSGWFVDSLARASWQGGLLAVAVWLVCQCFPRIPGTIRVWLWRLVFLKMFCTLVWFEPLDLAILPPETAAGTAVSKTEFQVPWVTGVPIQTQPASLESTIPTTAVFVSASPERASSPPALVRSSVHWPTVAISFWLLGTLACLGRLAIHFRRACALRRGSVPCGDDRIFEILIPLARSLGLRAVPRLRLARTMTRPMLIGIVRPTLIFPETVLATAAPETLRMMIAHELAHVRRMDLAWSAFGAVAQSLFFFHPLAWVASRESILAQESACDELAIRATSSTAMSYAEMLVEVVATPVRTAPQVFSIGIAENRNSLERRIRNMKFIGHKKNVITRWISSLALVAGLAALIPVRLVEAQVAEADLEKSAGESSKSQRITVEPPSSQLQHSPTDTSTRRRVVPRNAVQQATPPPIENLNASRFLLEQLRARPREDLRKILPTVVPDGNLERLLGDLAKVEQQWSSITLDYSDEHPEVKRVMEVLATINRQIDDRIDGILAGLELQAAQNEKTTQRPRNQEAENQFLSTRGGPDGPIPVYSRVGGMVEKVHVKVGDKVTTGQLLVEMDATSSRTHLQTAEARARIAAAEVAIARADLQGVEREYTQKLNSLSNLEKSKAYVTKAEALLEIAQIETEQARAEVQSFRLTSPVNGVVTRIVHVGYLVPERGGKILVEVARQREESRTIEEVESELALLRKEEAVLLEKYRPNHPAVIQATREIADLTSRLRTLRLDREDGRVGNPQL